jgi:hypothetical protein
VPNKIDVRLGRFRGVGRDGFEEGRDRDAGGFRRADGVGADTALLLAIFSSINPFSSFWQGPGIPRVRRGLTANQSPAPHP